MGEKCVLFAMQSINMGYKCAGMRQKNNFHKHSRQCIMVAHCNDVNGKMQAMQCSAVYA